MTAPSRRRLLQVSAGGALLLALGGVGLALQPTAPRTPPGPLQALSPRQYAVLVAVAEVVLPPRAGLPTAEEVGVAAKVDALLARLHPGVAAELGQALLLLENALPGLILDQRARPFTQGSLEERTRVLERWRTSRLKVRRQVVRGLSALVSSAYWSDPRTHAFVGYRGPPAWILQIRDAEPIDAW